MVPIWFAGVTLVAGVLATVVAQHPRTHPLAEILRQALDEAAALLFVLFVVGLPAAVSIYFAVALAAGLITGDAGVDVIARIPWQVDASVVTLYVLGVSVVAGRIGAGR